MNSKLEAILSDTDKVRIFTEDNCLVTTHFVIFLLFGCNEDQRRIISTKAGKLIAERRAFAMVDVPDNPNIVQAVEDAVEAASKARIHVENLNEMHLCPVIISENADPSVYRDAISAVNAYCKKRDIRTEWKAFLLLNTISGNASAWLGAIVEGIAALGSMYSCRCCVLTHKDEDGFAVAEERLLTTVLFVAFLNTVRETREEIGRQIVFDKDDTDELFYTAQTAFIENPVVTRVFNRMSGLLDRLCKRPHQGRDVDMGFMHRILQSRFEKMPMENGSISLLPLYSVMPGTDLELRLRRFARAHYLSFTSGAKEKNALYAQITKDFLNACVKLGWDAEALKALVDNGEELGRIADAAPRKIPVESYPPYPGRGDLSGVYDTVADDLRRKLTALGRELLQNYFASDDFTALPKKYHAVMEALRDERTAMTEIAHGRSEQDILLPLINDPDEKWIDAESGKESVVDGFLQNLCHMALAENDEIRAEELSALLDRLYQVSKSLSGGNSAQSYMKLVSDTCADTDSDAARTCVTAIGARLRFPIRVQGNIGKEPSYTYLWGSEENNLYSVWERYHAIINTKSRLLPLKSNERFAILRVSAPFSRQKILSIDGGVSIDGGGDMR